MEVQEQDGPGGVELVGHQMEATKLEDGSDVVESEDDGALAVGGGGLEGKNRTKKKKKKGKKKKAAGPAERLGSIPDELPAPGPETTEETAKWEMELQKGCRTYQLPEWGLVDERTRFILNTFLTPSCRQMELVTPRLKLRQVEVGDTTGIRRIKMEPIVQKTQLYGSPSISDIKESFQNRYIRSSIPRIAITRGGKGRGEHIFAITARDPASITIRPPAGLKIPNRIASAEGYLGNIALSLSFENMTEPLLPKKGEIFVQPTFEQYTEAGLTAYMFYEIHPQLWGQGVMSEAFVEVLRFAMEEVGCQTVQSDPTTTNEASIRLCVKNGMRYTKTENNEHNKPQMFHEISREEWWSRNRPGQKVQDRWGGKKVCRWCMNFRQAPPTIQCSHCDWAKYCSRECQRADWLRQGGHQAECDWK
ncbi:hypothetical protein IAR55_005072 [Kwoniella newhampshirensis]|uniref:MYND-type domain-containing protein n=1 Tax=Kwoniella newhampshirensis TaxID=1651941 RepID=A0AAW0YWG3_9TREE